MPNWKKVLTSGSAGELSSLFAPSITGSLQGTASFAISASYAISSSYADTASFSLATTENRILVLNQSGYTISKGIVVHITASGTSSDIPRVVSASYESDLFSANTLGIASQTITNGSQGYVTTEGVLTGIDTSAFVSGQLIFLGASGTITGSAPQAPLHSVRLGQIVREQSVNGSMYVRIDNGYEMNELHDVIDTTTTASYGDLFIKSGSVWINSRQLTGSYGLTGSLTVTGSTATDLVRITQTGTGNAFVVEDSTNPDNTPFVVDNAGNVAIGITSPSRLLHTSGSTNITSVPLFEGMASSETRFLMDTSVGNSQRSARLLFSQQDPTKSTCIFAVSGSIYFSTSASYNSTSGLTRMYISESGNIGIGTVQPTLGLLQVNGNVYATSFTGSLQGTASYATAAVTAISASTVFIEYGYNIDTEYPVLFSILSASYAAPATDTNISYNTFRDRLTVTNISSSTITGSLLGTATSALTASYVNTLNQNVIITGSVAIGTGSIGASENTLTLGAKDAVSEGGQLGFNAPGGSYISASMIDLYQNRLRILKGTNAGSTGEVAGWNMHTLQMNLPGYTNASSFTGTATANLAVDSGGNVITVSTTGGTVFPYTGNAVITGSLTVTQPIYVPINGAMYFQGGDDAALYDFNVVNTMGIYGVQDVTVGAVKLGSNGPVLYGSSSKLGIGTINPSSASLMVNGNVWATSFTGSYTGSLVGALIGTASWANNVVSASYALTASYVANASSFPYTGSALITGSLGVTGSVSITQNITGSRMLLSSSNGTISGSTLTVYGSGSSNPVFTIQGSQGELFSVTDSLSGSLFSVNDISGLPILEVFSDNRVLIGDFQAPALFTTKKVTTTAASFVVYNGLPTASYDGAWFEYMARSGSNARAGSIMAIWSGSSINYTETTTTDFGTTADLAFRVIITGSNMALTGSSTNTGWSIKTIIRSI